MDRDEWIAKRAAEIQRRRQEKERIAEENGYPFYGGDDVSYEVAEEEYNSLYGVEDEDE